jgi:hypothetical protein
MAEGRPAESEKPAEKSGRKGGRKTVITVGGLLVVEAVLIVGAMTLVGGDPDVAVAGTHEVDPDLAAQEEVVEILVLDGKLANSRGGIGYLYPTEIYAQVKQRNADRVKATVSQFQNEIKSEIAAIWRTSEAEHFQEPRLETLTRKVQALLSDRFGRDPESDEPVLVKCVLVMSTGLRTS